MMIKLILNRWITFFALVAFILVTFQTSFPSLTLTQIPLERSPVSKNVTRDEHLFSVEKGSIGTKEEGGFAACLLTSDDNIILPEWIAYHYTVLPLRYLVILNDPRSTELPSEVVKRWDNIPQVNLKYWLWNESDAMDANLTKRAEKLLLEGGHMQNHKRLRLRQESFIRRCNLFYQRQNLTWVTHIDTDEFIVPNRVNPFDYRYLSKIKNEKENEKSFHFPNTTIREIINFRNKSIPSDPMTTPTVAKLMKIAQQQIPGIGGCQGMPRLSITSKENGFKCNKSVVESSLSSEGFPKNLVNSLETIRYVQSAKRDDFGANQWGKAMVDVSSWPKQTLMKKVKNVHRPIYPECRKPVISSNEALLVVHHYYGSLERYQSRSDDIRYVRTKKGWEERSNLTGGYEDTCDMHVNSWLDKFIKEVGGAKQASYLLGWHNNTTNN